MNTVNERLVKVDDMVTIVEWYGAPDEHAWCGNVLRVLAVDWPYCVVSEVYQDKLKVHLDFRRVDLKVLSPEYVEALIPGEPQPGGGT